MFELGGIFGRGLTEERLPWRKLAMTTQNNQALLDPKKVAEAVRDGSPPLSPFEEAMKKARGFHEYYQGTLTDNIVLRPLEI